MSDAEEPGLVQPFVTEHALDQWDDRTPSDAVSPETAWRHSSRSVRLARLLGVDEARYHAATDTVLIRTDNAVPTVYDVTPDPACGGLAPAVYRTVREQFPHAATDGGEPR